MKKFNPEEIRRLNDVVSKIFNEDYINELISKLSEMRCTDMEFQFYLNETEGTVPMFITQNPVTLYLGEGRYLEETEIPEEDEYVTLEIACVLNLSVELYSTIEEWLEYFTLRDTIEELIPGSEVDITLTQNNIIPEDVRRYGLSSIMKNITVNQDFSIYPMICISVDLF